MDVKHQGQALIEYILVFALFSTIALGIAKGIGDYSTDVFQSFAFQLTKELSVGTCNRRCWHTGYKNGE